jgi:uncharacterized protein YegL
MRRLPVYLLLDCSGSMTGEPIEQVKNGLQMLISGLRQDPHALETVWLSVITFADSVHEAVPLTELTAFQAPFIQASGQTKMGDALRMVTDCSTRDVVKSTASKKGDWRPMVFIMTDGQPTDEPEEWAAGLAHFKSKTWGSVVACAVDDADVDILKQITDDAGIVKLDTSSSTAMRAFFKWVTDSVSASSKSIGPDDGMMPPPPPEIQPFI